MISVIIPTRHRLGNLQALLRSLMSFSHPLMNEVLVICNEHEPETEKWLNTLKTPFRLSYGYTGKTGVNYARNLGLKKKDPSCKWALFLDDDCYFESMEQVVHLIEAVKSTTADAVAGYYKMIQGDWLNKIYYLKKKTWLDYYSYQNSGTRALGGFVAFKAAAICGLSFNEKITFGGSETDFILKFVKAGHRIYISDHIQINHNYTNSWSDLCIKFYKQGSHFYSMSPADHKSQSLNSFKSIYLLNLQKTSWPNWQKTLVRYLTFIHSIFFKFGQSRKLS